MKRVILALLIIILVSACGGVSLAQIETDVAPTYGTPASETITGTNGRDIIDATQGGADAVNSKDGRDTVYTNDGVADDVVNCGGGNNDAATVDEGDVTSNCDGNVTRVHIVPPPPPPPPPLEGGALVGVYEGWHDQVGVDAFYSWLGSPDGYQRPELGHEFMDHQTWTDFDNASGHFGGWKTWVAANDTQRRFSVSMPLLTFSNDKQFASCAAGNFDSHFANVANFMKDTVLQDTIIRLGWEMNGFGPYSNGWPWSIAGQNLNDYKACYQRAVTTMNNIEPSLEFEWEPNVTKDVANLTLEQMYPGDAYADYVGLGLYDYCAFTCTSDTPAGRWQMLQDPIAGDEFDNGMLHHARFAAAHGKQMTYTEYGLWQETFGGGDDPTFIDNMANWIASHPVHHHVYNNVSHHNLDLYPNAKAEYRVRFGE